MTERLPTGIAGLDALIGGLPAGSRTVLLGPPGTGKTVFAMQFCWTGLQAGERVAYDVCDRPWPALRRYFASFGWDVEPYEASGHLLPVQAFPHFEPYPRDHRVRYLDIADLDAVKAVDRLLSKAGVRRFVAGDLSSALFGRLPRESLQPLEEWTAAWTFYDGIAGIDIFTDAPLEPAAAVHLAEHLVGVQAILRFGWDGGQRVLRIEKLEGCEHPLAWIPLAITPNGIEI
ncbi:MAG: RAD55 family ATPase [Candidatus Tectimicrobiota bacterium]